MKQFPLRFGKILSLVLALVLPNISLTKKENILGDVTGLIGLPIPQHYYSGFFSLGSLNRNVLPFTFNYLFWFIVVVLISMLLFDKAFLKAPQKFKYFVLSNLFYIGLALVLYYLFRTVEIFEYTSSENSFYNVFDLVNWLIFSIISLYFLILSFKLYKNRIKWMEDYVGLKTISTSDEKIFKIKILITSLLFVLLIFFTLVAAIGNAYLITNTTYFKDFLSLI